MWLCFRYVLAKVPMKGIWLFFPLVPTSHRGWVVGTKWHCLKVAKRVFSFSLKLFLLRSFHLYNSKILEKTFNNINCLIRLGLMPFWLMSFPVIIYTDFRYFITYTLSYFWVSWYIHQPISS